MLANCEGINSAVGTVGQGRIATRDGAGISRTGLPMTPIFVRLLPQAHLLLSPWPGAQGSVPEGASECLWPP